MARATSDDRPPALRPHAATARLSPGPTTPPPNPARATAPPTEPPVFFECWKCGYSLDGLNIRHNVACPECGFVLRRRLARPRCPCGGELPDPDRRGVVRCPACGRESPARVPDANWPLRCATCRCDLTGQAIDAGRIRCPACGDFTRWRRGGAGAGLGAGQAAATLLRPTAIMAMALGVVLAVVLVLVAIL